MLLLNGRFALLALGSESDDALHRLVRYALLKKLYKMISPSLLGWKASSNIGGSQTISKSFPQVFKHEPLNNRFGYLMIMN
jgi:hypothetical protein